MAVQNMICERFGRLTVIQKDNARDNSHDSYWVCKCDCGNEISVTTGHLRSGSVRSCGCLKRETSIKNFKKASEKNITHGEAGTRLYNIWHSMKQRCSNPNDSHSKWYFDKGVSICKEWDSYAAFSEWAHANGYAENLTIDRIDSNGDYCPDNCRWITASENVRRALKDRWKR